MNNTNRALNRAVVAVIGLLTLMVGAALAAVATVPAIRADYRMTAPGVRGALTSWLKARPLFETGTSWGWVLALVALAVIVALLLIFIFRQGHGQQDTLVREDTTSAGATVIDSDVAAHAIQHDLDGRPELLAAHVSTYQVRRIPVLKVSVTCRRGVSPRQVADLVENTLTALDALIGRQIPTLIQVSGGFRARLSRNTRASSRQLRHSLMNPPSSARATDRPDRAGR